MGKGSSTVAIDRIGHHLAEQDNRVYALCISRYAVYSKGATTKVAEVEAHGCEMGKDAGHHNSIGGRELHDVRE